MLVNVGLGESSAGANLSGVEAWIWAVSALGWLGS